MADDRSRIEKLMAMARQDASPRERDTARDILGKMGLWPEHDEAVNRLNRTLADDDAAAAASAAFAAFARDLPLYEMQWSGTANTGTRFHVTSLRFRRRNTTRTTQATGFGPRPYVIFDEQA